MRARIQLVSDRLTPQQERELWQSVDCREWFIRVLAHDFAAEMEKIDRELEDALRQ